MNWIKYTIATVVAVVSLNSCTEDIDLKLNTSGRRLVVEGFLTTDTMTQYIRLTYSGDYYDNQAMPTVPGATVTISTDVEELLLTEKDNYPGYYFTPTDFYGKQGKTYHLSISNVDANSDGELETYEADSQLPELITGDSIQIGFDKNWNLWKVLLYAKDPANIDNFYAFRVLRNDSLLSSKLSQYEQTNDVFFDGNPIDGVWVFGLDDEKEDEKLHKNDKVTLEMFNINETFYDYLVGVDEETSPKTPLFSGSSANVPGNISNGALGIFTTYAVSRISTINTKSKDEWDK